MCHTREKEEHLNVDFDVFYDSGAPNARTQAVPIKHDEKPGKLKTKFNCIKLHLEAGVMQRIHSYIHSIPVSAFLYLRCGSDERTL
jgi:hypothetical protein